MWFASLIPTDSTSTPPTAWLELGNWREANEELDRITPVSSARDVLAARRVVCSQPSNWELALEIAGTLAAADPYNYSGVVIRLASTLDKLNRVQEAYDFLVAAAPNFPEGYRLRYDLARYCCKLGKLKEDPKD